ncbi:hypothetical protein GCM10027596_03120 [Nocardioides korecus]
MTTSHLEVDTDDPTPAYEQLRRQLQDLVGSGALAPGDRLPPLRQLAGDLGLAVGTVARAYRELEGAGLLVSRRGGGTRVAPRVDWVQRDDVRLEQGLERLAATYLARARALGASRAEAQAALGRVAQASAAAPQ